MKKKNRVRYLLVCALMISLIFTQLALPTQAASQAIHTQSEAMAWLENLAKNKTKIRSGQCVELIKEYYYYLTGDSSWQGKALGNANTYDTNQIPSCFTRIKGAAPQVGDVCVTEAGQYGHVWIHGSGGVTYHQNYNKQLFVTKVTVKQSNGVCVIRPNFKTTQSDQIPALATFDNIKNGTYVLTNVGSGYAMNYSYGTNGLPIVMSKVGDEDNKEQHFNFVHVGAGKYRIEITHPEGGVINCYCSLPVTAGVGVTGAKYTNNDTQHFYISPVGDGTFIINSASDPYLVIGAETSEWHSKLVIQNYSASNKLQRWTFNVNPLATVTNTPMPTFAVPTVAATATPVPTATATPKPTATATPKPTATVAPTAAPTTAAPTTAVTAEPSPVVTEAPAVTEAPVTTPDATAVGTEFTFDGSKLKVTGDTTVEFVKASNDSIVKIPSTVELNGKTYIVNSVADKAFMNNKKLTQIIIGKNVTKIGENAFYGCKKLKTVSGGENVKTIGFGAFMECTKLKSITIGPKVTSIGASAFQGDKSLKTVIVKSKKLKAKKVGANAFKGIAKKAVFKIPKAKAKKYQPMFKKVSKGTKITFKKS